jgi:hypothetical protein
LWGACRARERGVGGNVCGPLHIFPEWHNWAQGAGRKECGLHVGDNARGDAAVLSLVHVSLRLPPARLCPYFPAS